MSQRRPNPATDGSIHAFLFGFFTIVAALGLLATLAVYSIAAVRGKGVGPADLAPWIVVGSIIAAIAFSPGVRANSEDEPTIHRSMTLGIATAGIVTALASVFSVLAPAVESLSNWLEAGPLQLVFTSLGAVVALASPLIARAMRGARLAERLSSLLVGAADDPDDRFANATSSLNRHLALIAGGVVLAVGLAYVLTGGPFGHDESIYALKARSWTDGTPSTGFSIYRPVGLPVVGWVVLQFSDADMAFRSAAVVLSIGAAGVTWLSGRMMFGVGAAWIGTTVFVASESYLRRATEFLNDLSAAGLLLATMLAIWYHFERRPNGWWLLACAPLGAGAYYMRYGSALGLATIGVVAAIVWARHLVLARRQIATTAAAIVALLVPHFIYARSETGSILGVLRSASTSVGGGGGGLADYFAWLPEHLAGRLGATVMLAAVIYTAHIVVRAVRYPVDERCRSEARTVVFLMAVAVVLTVALGAFTHGEPRFVFMPLMAVLLVGGQALVRLTDMLRHTPRVVSAAAFGIVVAVMFTGSAVHMARGMDRITGARDVIAGSADAVRADVGPGDCSVRSSYIPQITWYSACATYSFGQALPSADPAYLAMFDKGKRQPTGAEREKEIAMTTGELIAVVNDPHQRIGDGHVYRYPTNQ